MGYLGLSTNPGSVLQKTKVKVNALGKRAVSVISSSGKRSPKMLDFLNHCEVVLSAIRIESLGSHPAFCMLCSWICPCKEPFAF